MPNADAGGDPGGSLVADWLAIARFHIVLVAMAACLVFGWLMTGRYLVVLPLVVAADWFVINLLNRITDIDEDLRNGIAGTARVARQRRGFVALAVAVVVVSFAATAWAWPGLTPYRAIVQAIGAAYSYRLVPTPSGFKRLKELYFLKNFMSAVLFVLTCFVYPLAVDPAARLMPWAGVVALALFFVPFELTFEILYDMRDLEGDRAEGIPTYPVVHGVEASRRIIDGLLLLAAAVLAGALASGALGLREGLMLAAPASQFGFYRPRYRRGLTSRDCIVLTHLASAQLALYLVGTAVWSRAGLPSNVFLR